MRGWGEEGRGGGGGGRCEIKDARNILMPIGDAVCEDVRMCV